MITAKRSSAWRLWIGTICCLMAMGALADSPELNADAMPTEPQETTASLGRSKAARVHQWGIVRLPKTPAADAGQLSTPDFVHSAAGKGSAAALLDYSALYVHPPMMLAEHLKFDVSIMTSGTATGWYPYATAEEGKVTWNGVLAGVQADGLIIDHPIWMGARAVASPATLKVYRPGPPGTKPDDPGTTEGDVFLFYRAELDSAPLKVEETDGEKSVVMATGATTAPLYGWTLAPAVAPDDAPAGELYFEVRGITSAANAAGQHDRVPIPSVTDMRYNPQDRAAVRATFNEAFVGHGLDPDEADALSRTLLAAAAQSRGRQLIMILPEGWADLVLPLQITGSQADPPRRVFVAVVPF